MAKDDAPIPEEIPRKRRALEAAPDVWLASWLAGNALTPSERRRLQAEKDRRKALRARESRVVGIVVGAEGLAPPQFDAMREALTAAHATEIRFGGQSPRWLRWSAHLLDVPLISYEDARGAVQQAQLVIAGPREMSVPENVPAWDRSPVWAAIAYAKHRRVAVKIIMPDGREAT